MKDDTVAGIVITLILVLGNGAGSDLEYDAEKKTGRCDSLSFKKVYIYIMLDAGIKP